MTQFVTLDNDQHAELKVRHEYTPEGGALVNQTRIFITEFEELQKEYTILFRKAENDEFYAVTLLGFDKDENLFLNGTSWSARYIPAAFRRGPFQIGRVQQTDGSAKSIINIDMDDPRINKDNGNALFLPNGGHTPYLKQISKTLDMIHVGLNHEQSFFSHLKKYDLIKAITVQIPLSDSKSYTIPDIYSIDQEKLRAMTGKDLEEIHQSGFLSLCQWVLSSLSNTNNLLERKLRKQSQDTQA